MFVLDEIYVRGTKLVYEHMRVGNVRKNIPKYHTWALEEGPFKSAQDCSRQTTNGLESTPSGPVNAPVVRYIQLVLSNGRVEDKYQPQSQTTDQ